MHNNLDKQNKDKYCKFHRDHGHNTDDCIELKQQIEDLIRCGRLQRFVANKQHRPRPKEHEAQREKPLEPIGEIRVIHGGLAGGGESNSAGKNHLRRLRTENSQEVYFVGRTSLKGKEDDQPIGRATLNAIQAVVSTHHLKMKFPTSVRIGEAK